MDKQAGPRILVVDDDQGKRYVIARHLKRAGYRVIEAATGAEALRLLQEPLDLLVVDIHLPDISGMEVTRMVKADPRTADLMTLQLSASFTSTPDRVQGLNSGADAYLVHPVETAELLATVRALLRIRQAERERAEFREQLVAIVGHDLRNPLAAIELFAQSMQRRGLLSEPDARSTGRILDTTRRMGRIIEQVLDFTRSRLGGGLPIHPKPMRLAALCQQIIEELGQGAQGRDLRLEVEGDTEGCWDSDRLGQVVSNLLGNALQHGSEGQPITLRLVGEEEAVVLSVHNYGAPIPAELMPVLFEPFRRGETEHVSGLGLGLYIVRNVVTAHGGTTTATSIAEEGTTFVVRLPRRSVS